MKKVYLFQKLAVSLIIAVLFFGCSSGIKDKSISSASGENTGITDTDLKNNSDSKVKDKIESGNKDNIKDNNKEKTIKNIDGLVLLKDIDESMVIDLRYASKNNFTGKVVYPVNACVLREETAGKLARANAEFKKGGYRIKVWDGYRPPYVQQIFWNMVKDERYVANPNKGGSRHNNGTAIDITLVDSVGNELVMPSGFDDFSARAQRNNPNMSISARKNLDYLTSIMIKCGFTPIETEWWHFEDSESSKYPIIDIQLEKFLE